VYKVHQHAPTWQEKFKKFLRRGARENVSPGPAVAFNGSAQIAGPISDFQVKYFRDDSGATNRVYFNVKIQSIPSHKPRIADLRLLILSQTPVYTARPFRDTGLVHRAMPAYVPAFAGTHCAYPRRDGQAELTWVAGYMSKVTHQNTNLARRRVTSLTKTTVHQARM